MRNEKAVTKEILEYLNSLPGCLAYKRHAGPNRKGKPDITGCLNGKRLEIEVKTGKNKPTALQKKWLKNWYNAGAISGCVWSLLDAVKLIVGNKTCEQKIKEFKLWKKNRAIRR